MTFVDKKTAYPIDLGENRHHVVAVATNDAKNRASASHGAAARRNLCGVNTTESRGHGKIVVRKTSIVARVRVSINRICQPIIASPGEGRLD
jgi:hypothetical protein